MQYGDTLKWDIYCQILRIYLILWQLISNIMCHHYLEYTYMWHILGGCFLCKVNSFGTWFYNKRHSRRGFFWSERFKQMGTGVGDVHNIITYYAISLNGCRFTSSSPRRTAWLTAGWVIICRPTRSGWSLILSSPRSTIGSREFAGGIYHQFKPISYQRKKSGPKR